MHRRGQIIFIDIRILLRIGIWLGIWIRLRIRIWLRRIDLKFRTHHNAGYCKCAAGAAATVFGERERQRDHRGYVVCERNYGWKFNGRDDRLKRCLHHP